MLKAATTQQKDAIEVLFCEPFEKLEKHPMSEELMKVMVQLFLAKDLDIPKEHKPFVFQVIEKRLRYCFTYQIKDQRLLLFLSFLTQSPGMAVAYLTYLQYWCKKRGVKELDFDTFCERIFPMGFPAEEDISKLWDEMKVERDKTMASDNLLDYPSAMISILN